MNKLSKYRVMWIILFFDLPTETQKNKKDYSCFRKNLIKDGFTMFQFSMYIRQCGSKENAEAHIHRVKTFLPNIGKVGILCITDKQFAAMLLFNEQIKCTPNAAYQQLELF